MTTQNNFNSTRTSKKKPFDHQRMTLMSNDTFMNSEERMHNMRNMEGKLDLNKYFPDEGQQIISQMENITPEQYVHESNAFQTLAYPSVKNVTHYDYQPQSAEEYPQRVTKQSNPNSDIFHLEGVKSSSQPKNGGPKNFADRIRNLTELGNYES